MEYEIPIDEWEISDNRIDKLCKATWYRLPSEVRLILSRNLNGVKMFQAWSMYIKQALLDMGIKTSPMKYNQQSSNQGLIREVHISHEDCVGLSDEVIIGAFVHELAHAYKAILLSDNPPDLNDIENAGDTLPIEWGFLNEINMAREIIDRENMGEVA